MRHVTRSDDEIIMILGDAEMGEMSRHFGGTARCVGQQHDEAAIATMTLQGLKGMRKMRHAIMHDTPDVTQPDGVTRRQIFHDALFCFGSERPSRQPI